MTGSPEEASSPEEERTASESCRSSNASSSSSSSSSNSSSSGSDDDKPSEPTSGTAGELEGAPPEEPTIDGVSSGIVNAQQEQQHQHKVKDVQETGMLSLRSDVMSSLMVAGGVAAAIVVAAAFLTNKKH